MPHSHHSHSGQFCRHAKDTLEQVIQEAIRQQFTVFGLTEHAPRYRPQDLFPEESDLHPEALERIYLDFLSSALNLRERYKDRISLLIGLETDYITSIDISRTAGLLEERKEIDYIVGSVHHVNGVSIDFDKPTWIRCIRTLSTGQEGTTMSISPGGGTVFLPEVENADTLPDKSEISIFLKAYFEAQYEMLKAHKPEVVGHFDLCLLWIPGTDLRGEDMEDVWELVVRNVKFVVGYGGLFEANAAAFRKGWQTSYPCPDILQLILSLKGRICLSDDSHGVSYVGLNYGEMRNYLLHQGVGEIYHLVPSSEARANDEDVGGRGRVKARRMAEWGDHAFWEGK